LLSWFVPPETVNSQLVFTGFSRICKILLEDFGGENTKGGILDAALGIFIIQP